MAAGNEKLTNVNLSNDGTYLNLKQSFFVLFSYTSWFVTTNILTCDYLGQNKSFYRYRVLSKRNYSPLKITKKNRS